MWGAPTLYFCGHVQRKRLEAQVRIHAEKVAAAKEGEEGEEAYEVAMDDDFVTALEYGMPPTAGMVRVPHSPSFFVDATVFSRCVVMLCKV